MSNWFYSLKKLYTSLCGVLIMTGNLSPDGKWLWNGKEWIPAPPQTPPSEPTLQTPSQFQTNHEIELESMDSQTIIIPTNYKSSTNNNLKILIGVGVVSLILLFAAIGAIILIDEEEDDKEYDLYVTYMVNCQDCGIVTADLDLIDGTTDSVIGFPDDEGIIEWEYKYTIKESLIDELLWAYMIASHDVDDDIIFATLISVDEFPRSMDQNCCLVDSDIEYGSYSSGSGGYFTYTQSVINCDAE